MSHRRPKYRLFSFNHKNTGPLINTWSDLGSKKNLQSFICRENTIVKEREKCLLTKITLEPYLLERERKGVYYEAGSMRRVSDIYREFFMESAGVRYLHTSCFCIRNRTSERIIVYILRHSSFWSPFYFKYSKMLKFAATHNEIQ